MRPEAKKLILDMVESVRLVAEFSQGRTLQNLQSDQLLRSAIFFQFTILGEALSQLRHLDDDAFESITDARKIVGFRNQIIHGYAKIDDEITWRILVDKLPILRRELDDLSRK